MSECPMLYDHRIELAGHSSVSGRRIDSVEMRRRRW